MSTAVNVIEAIVLKAFPNPSHNFMEIESNIDIREYYLFDSFGRKLAAKIKSKGQVDVSDLKSDIYYIGVHPMEANSIYTLKFIKL